MLAQTFYLQDPLLPQIGILAGIIIVGMFMAKRGMPIEIIGVLAILAILGGIALGIYPTWLLLFGLLVLGIAIVVKIASRAGGSEDT